MANQNFKTFSRNVLLGILVIIFTPILAGFLASIVTALGTVLFLGISWATLIGAGVSAWLAGMITERIKALN